MPTPAASRPEAAPLGPKHAKVRRLRALLRDPAVRDSEAAVALEGPRVVRDALARGVDLEAVYVPAGGATPDGLPRGCAVEVLRPGLLERLATTRTPQPVLGIAARPAPLDVAALGGDGCLLVLAAVSDPGNVGTLVRAAEASGAVGVAVGRGTADVFSPKVVRASAGSVFGVPIAVVDDLPAALEALGTAGRRRYGTAATGGVRYSEAGWSAPLALVIGNEAHGLTDDVLAAVDEMLTIPMAGAAESLNAAMAGSVLLFEAARRRDSGPRRSGPLS